MKKLDDIHWVDFVRGVADAGIEREIRARLEAGEGEEEARRWRRLASLARKDREREIPNEADHVRQVKAMGRLRGSGRAEPPARPLGWQTARLVFSGGGQEAPAGARSQETPARHLVFETGTFVVDVRIERQLPGATLAEPAASGVVNGQILRQSGEPQPVGDTTVLIFHGQEVVSSTVCDDSGEFQAENLPAGDLKLCLLVDRDQYIEIPLESA